MSRRSSSSLLDLANVLFSFANVLLSLGNLFQVPEQERRIHQIHALRAENLKLKNQREFIRQGSDHNKTVEGDLKIELLALKIKREKWAQKNAGIDAPTFSAQDYAEPGDVRRGIFLQ